MKEAIDLGLTIGCEEMSGVGEGIGVGEGCVKIGTGAGCTKEWSEEYEGI